MTKPKPKYKKGQLVRLKDGDGRPHHIKKIEWYHYGTGDWHYRYYLTNNHDMAESNLAPFLDEVLLEQLCNYMLCVDFGNYFPIEENDEIAAGRRRLIEDIHNNIREDLALHAPENQFNKNGRLI